MLKAGQPRCRLTKTAARDNAQRLHEVEEMLMHGVNFDAAQPRRLQGAV